MNSESSKLEFHYIKNNGFCTILGSGVFGGITPQGQLNINFFTERAAIPTKIVYAATQIGDKLKLDEIERDGKDGIIREVQCGVLMDINVAISFRAWLDEKINQFTSSSPQP